jgi:hypothetical protein
VIADIVLKKGILFMLPIKEDELGLSLLHDAVNELVPFTLSLSKGEGA